MDRHFWTAVAMLAAIALVRYVWKIRFRPAVDCTRCGGEGKHPRPFRRGRMMRCRRCRGERIRIRLGRRAVNRVVLARRKSNRIAERMKAAR